MIKPGVKVTVNTISDLFYRAYPKGTRFVVVRPQTEASSNWWVRKDGPLTPDQRVYLPQQGGLLIFRVNQLKRADSPFEVKR